MQFSVALLLALGVGFQKSDQVANVIITVGKLPSEGNHAGIRYTVTHSGKYFCLATSMQPFAIKQIGRFAPTRVATMTVS